MRMLLTAVAALLFAASAGADEFEVGVHYEVLPIPVETATPGRIEVVEVFSYGCVHCYGFDPVIEAWRAKQPADVAFRRVPAMFRQDWVILAQAYYAAEALGVLDKVHSAIFEAVHLKGLDFRNPQVLARVVNDAAGVDEAEFTRVLNSFGVRSKTQQADATGRMYRLAGVPTLIVDGRYRVYGGSIDATSGGMLAVVDHLVAKVREEAAP
jgi:protein dithiol oxidoreductase (disulfide-forming)